MYERPPAFPSLEALQFLQVHLTLLKTCLVPLGCTQVNPQKLGVTQLCDTNYQCEPALPFEETASLRLYLVLLARVCKAAMCISASSFTWSL